HLAMFGVQCGDDAISWKLAQDIRHRGRAEYDFCRAGIEPVQGGVHVADAAADAAWRDADQLANDRGVWRRLRCAATQRGVETDNRDLACQRELPPNGDRIAGIQNFFAAADELHGVSVHQIDRRNDQFRTSTPAAARNCFTSAMVVWPS